MAFSGITLARTKYDNEGEAQDELSFRRGEIVTVLQKDYGAPGWWLCQLQGRQGIVPYNYVRELTEDETSALFQTYDEPRKSNFQEEYLKHREKLSQGGAPGALVQPHGNSRSDIYDTPSVRKSPNDELRPSPTSIPDYAYTADHSSDEVDYTPSMTILEGQQILQRVNLTLESSSAKTLSAVGIDIAHLEGENLYQACRKVADAGREAHTALKDLITLSLETLRVAQKLQQTGRDPQICKMLVKPVMPIKESHVELSTQVAELEKGPDVLTARQTLTRIQTVLSSVKVPVSEFCSCVLSNAVMLFLPTATDDESRMYEVLPGDTRTIERTAPHTSYQTAQQRGSPDGASNLHGRSPSCEPLDRPDQSPSAQRRVLRTRPSQVSDTRLAARPVQPELSQLPNRSISSDSIDSPPANPRHSSSSSSSNDLTSDATLIKGTKGAHPITSVLGGLRVVPGDLTDGELSLLAYYAERMETLIPSVTNAVEAFCRAIGEKQVPKQFVWHSKMVVVGAYKMVYVADTVFQKLSHNELRNHIVACSNRLVDSIKNIVEFTKVAAQQFPSVGAMKDMVESVSHLPPLALDLAESIKEAASLR